MSARTRFFTGPIHGRTHRSAPTRWGRCSGTNGERCENGSRTRGGTEPAPYRGVEQDSASGGGVRSPRSTEATQVVPSNGPMWASAPTESPINHPSQPARSEASAARMGGRGGNRRKDHPKRGTAAATARAALSEAESAERETGQIRSLPDDLRVQHGVPCPEVSAQLRPCSRRGCGN